ncbi:uncharacterized protein LOC113304980 [Papaver somniferum]|uniref:uncharacterized protein LOC113304980 n=1 Tax=Papaver somniferum TaxID=3469 RepID=UPI000E700F51|nr:uncharacterized protein LOC113304980 [Papaver somniferum]
MPALTDSTSVISTTTTITTTITTTKSSKSPLPPINRKQDHQTTSRRPCRKPNTSTALTEENLEELKRRQKGEKKYANSSSSPYYKGLTDSTLIITRQRGSLAVSVDRSPTKNSNVSGRSSSSSSSSIFVRIQVWSSSCFRNNKNDTNGEPFYSVYNQTMTTNPSSAPSTTNTTRKQLSGVISSNNNDPGLVMKDESTPPLLMEENKRRLLTMKEKSLKERASFWSSEATDIALDDNGNAVGGETISLKKKTKKNEKKYVWADMYGPTALKDFICNRDKAENLHNLVKEGGECSHYIFEGPAGVGKTTMVWAFLREVFGVEDLETREERKTFELNGEAEPSIDVRVKLSSKHVEINLSQLHGYEKHVIAAIIRETQSIMITKNKVKPKCDPPNCYAIIIHEADKLPRDSQLYIRWLLERNNQNFRNRTQLILKLCILQIVQVLKFIAGKERIQLPTQLAERIAENSKHNLRQAIRSFEATWHFYNEFSEDQVLLTGWEEDVANIAENIIEEQSPRQYVASFR